MPKRKRTEKTGITSALIKRIQEARERASRIPGTRTAEELRAMRRKRREILNEAERLMKQNSELAEKDAILQAAKNVKMKKLHGGNF